MVRCAVSACIIDVLHLPCIVRLSMGAGLAGKQELQFVYSRAIKIYRRFQSLKKHEITNFAGLDEVARLRMDFDSFRDALESCGRMTIKYDQEFVDEAAPSMQNAAVDVGENLSQAL